MPPAYVRTIREEILYEYAKLISRSAMGNINYGFVSDRFKKLKSDEISMSGTIREWEREQELPRTCVFCGATEDLSTDHLIPRNRGATTARTTSSCPAGPATRPEATRAYSNGSAWTRRMNCTGWWRAST